MTKIQNELSIYLKYLKRDVLTFSKFIAYPLMFILFSSLSNWAYDNAFLDNKEITGFSPMPWHYFPYLFVIIAIYAEFGYLYFDKKKTIINAIKSNSIKLDPSTNFGLFLISNKLFDKSLYSLELDKLKLTLEDTNDLIKILNNNSISNLTILNCTFSEKHLLFLIPYIKNTKTLIKFTTTGTNLSKQIELNEFAPNSAAELAAIVDEVKTSLSAWAAFLTYDPFLRTPPPKDLYNDKYKLIIPDSK